MKTIFFIATFLFMSKFIYGQTEERFMVKGSAKLIASWSGKTLSDVKGTLTSGDKISITTRQIGIYVNVIHNNEVKELVTAGGEDILESTVMKVYEYDFDNDGQKEIIVIHSPEFSILTVEVFRYSGGLTERVGNFNGQFDVILDKNSIYLPYGSQGLGDIYTYSNGAFFELVYHDPDKKVE